MQIKNELGGLCPPPPFSYPSGSCLIQEATEAVLDTLIERTSQKAIKVHYSLLEADDNGDIQPRKRSILKYIVNTENKVCLSLLLLYNMHAYHVCMK